MSIILHSIKSCLNIFSFDKNLFKACRNVTPQFPIRHDNLSIEFTWIFTYFIVWWKKLFWINTLHQKIKTSNGTPTIFFKPYQIQYMENYFHMDHVRKVCITGYPYLWTELHHFWDRNCYGLHQHSSVRPVLCEEHCHVFVDIFMNFTRSHEEGAAMYLNCFTPWIRVLLGLKIHQENIVHRIYW